MIKDLVIEIKPEAKTIQPFYLEFRPGHVRNSLADISKAQNLIAYDPQMLVLQGLKLASYWYAGIFARFFSLKHGSSKPVRRESHLRNERRVEA